MKLDKELMQRVHQEQFAQNYSKNRYPIIFLILLIIYYIFSPKFGLKGNIYEDKSINEYLIITNSIFVILYIAAHFVMKTIFKQHEKAKPWLFIKGMVYAPIFFIIYEEIYLIRVSNKSLLFLILYPAIIFSFVALYDLPAIEFSIIFTLMTAFVGYYSLKANVVEKITLTYIITIYYFVIIIVNCIIDRYSCKNIAIQIKIEEENIEKNEQLGSMQKEFIYSLSNLIEFRSGETGEHVKRTGTLVKFLAKKAYEQNLYPNILTKNYLQLAYRVAPLHDVGKIKVPDSILLYPGKLSDEQFEQIKKHTEEGEAILESILGTIENKEYLNMAKEIAKYHHERWDGTGYPNGLKGEEIPLCARIMALADVYDALISKRCYKDSISKEEAIKIIKSESGKQFDPKLTEIFIKEIKKSCF